MKEIDLVTLDKLIAERAAWRNGERVVALPMEVVALFRESVHLAECIANAESRAARDGATFAEALEPARGMLERAHAAGGDERAAALVATKLDEAELWFTRAVPQEIE